MKKFFIAVITAFLVSCSNNDILDNYTDNSTVELGTRASLSLASNGVQLGTNAIDSKIEEAHFFIRVDNRIPGAESFPSTYYIPQKANGNTLFGEGNKGYLDVNKASWKFLNNKITKYLYDTTGKTTIGPIESIPDITSILKAHQKLISALNPDTLKVIWYVTKYEESKWHIDGILTFKSTNSTDEIPGVDKIDGMDNDADTLLGSVEVNFGISDTIKYGQAEAHLSVHVRDTTDFKIFIPISASYYCNKDDMTIVAKHDINYTYKASEQSVTHNINGNNIIFTISYNNTGITVESKGINSAILKYLRKTYQDGLTFEIRNYYNTDNLNELTEQLNKTTISFNTRPLYYIQAIGKYNNQLDPYPIYVKDKEGFIEDSIITNEGNNQSWLKIYKREN